MIKREPKQKIDIVWQNSQSDVGVTDLAPPHSPSLAEFFQAARSVEGDLRDHLVPHRISVFHFCRNWHCPVCQRRQAAQWLERQ